MTTVLMGVDLLTTVLMGVDLLTTDLSAHGPQLRFIGFELVRVKIKGRGSDSSVRVSVRVRVTVAVRGKIHGVVLVLGSGLPLGSGPAREGPRV